MVTADVIPNADITTEWSVNPGGTHFTTLDEDKGLPDQGDYITCTEGDNNKTDTFHMDDTIQDCDEYTQVQVYLFIRNLESTEGTPRTVNIYVNGGWLIPQDIDTGAGVWKSYTWAGLSGNQASLDALQVTVKTDIMTADKYVNDVIWIYTMYAVITYTEAAVGYGHDFLGIPAANIDSIMGIPTANIDNICGL